MQFVNRLYSRAVSDFVIIRNEHATSHSLIWMCVCYRRDSLEVRELMKNSRYITF